MPDEIDRTQYHHGFYAAMKVEYALRNAPVSYDQEKELGEKPIRLDFLIIKTEKDAVLTDPIGKFFRPYNLFEYKSPKDSLSIDDFYKAQGYGLVYKSFDRKINELPIGDMTMTLVRHSYPRELFKELEHEGFTAQESHPGIFKITGNISLATQIVVTSRLPKNEYAGLKLLADGCTKEALIEYAEQAIASDNEIVTANAEAVIRVCLQANETLGKTLEGDRDMEDIFSKFVRKKIDATRTETQEKTLVTTIRNLMETAGWSIQQTMNAMKIPVGEQEKYAKQIAASAV